MSTIGIQANQKLYQGWAWALLVIACLGTLLIIGSALQMRNRMQTDMKAAARRIARGVETAALQSLAGNESDLARPAYSRIKNYLALIRSDNPDFRFVYLMGRNAEGKIFFFADSEPADSEDESGPGDLFAEADEAEHLVLDTGTTLAFDPTEDQWGVWASAYAPVVDPATGLILAILGLDIAASDWHRQLLQSAIPPATLTLTLLLLTLLLAHLSAKRNATPHRQSARARDEVLIGVVLLGLLATAYGAWFNHRIERNNMRQSLLRMAEAELTYTQQKLRTVQNVQIPAFSHLMQIRPDLPRSEFMRFTMVQVPDLEHTWIWAPAVRPDDHSNFINTLRETYGEDVHIHEYDSTGTHQTVANRPLHFPIQHIDTIHTNAPTPGFDLASLPHLYETIRHAEETRLPTATHHHNWPAPDGGTQSAVIAFSPVFQHDNPARLQGVLVNISYFQNLIKSSSLQAPLDIDAHPLHHEQPPEQAPPAQPSIHRVTTVLPVSGYISMMGQTYRLDVRPNKEFARLHPPRTAFWTSALGLLGTAAIAILVGYPRRHRRVLERLVERRTKQLSENQVRYEMLTR
jgi:CHASE1-domain containing sensor protein